MRTIFPKTAPLVVEEVPETQPEHEVEETSAMEIEVAQTTLSTENPDPTPTHQDDLTFQVASPSLEIPATETVATETLAAPQATEKQSPVIIRADSVDMDQFLDDPTNPPAQTCPIPPAVDIGKAGVGIDEWISLLSGSSSKTSPMSARSSTFPGDNATERLNGLLEELKRFFKHSFDDLYSNQELRNKLIRVVKELQNSRKKLPPIHRGHINTLHEFIEELVPKLLELDGSILPYQQANTAKHELRDKLVRLRQKRTTLVEKNAPYKAKIPELERNIARLKQELASAESQLQEAIKASCPEEIAALDQEMTNSTAEAQTILSKVEALEVRYVNAEGTKMELAATWEDIRNIPL